MRIRNIEQLNAFVDAVNKCEGSVWLESPDGDTFNLKSQFSRYIALGKLLSEKGEYLELFCGERADEKNFFEFLANHPEV